jgi:hypothetical protein
VKTIDAFELVELLDDAEMAKLTISVTEAAVKTVLKRVRKLGPDGIAGVTSESAINLVNALVISSLVAGAANLAEAGNAKKLLSELIRQNNLVLQ